MKLKFKEHNYPGNLFVFCGLDGSGKTTLIEYLNNELKNNNYQTVITKQPTNDIRKNEMFRTYMDTANVNNYDYRALSLLCASDRLQHNLEIEKQLKEGKTVICDRYYYSCLANLLARGYIYDKWIYEIVNGIVKPDITFFLNTNVDLAINRVLSRPEEKNRHINYEFQLKLFEAFNKIFDENDCVIIDTDIPFKKSINKMMNEVTGVINK